MYQNIIIQGMNTNDQNAKLKNTLILINCCLIVFIGI